MSTQETIVIVGGGAAGMMAAAAIHETGIEGARTILLEKNPSLGRKVIISGGGRCNVTTGIHDVRELLTRYARGNKFLTSAMYNFPPGQVYEWFEDHGVPLKTEEDMRVFPQSNDGKDIVGVFERLFADSGIEVRTKSGLQSVKRVGEQFELTLKSGETMTADKLILTTGGQAYRKTGSTGDGYAFAEALGHTVTALAPSLNSFVVEEEWPTDLSGVSFENVGMRVKAAAAHGKQKENISVEGPIVFTHKGISGPAVFALSAKIAFEEYTPEQPLLMHLNLLPHMNPDSIVEALQHGLNGIEVSPKQYFHKTVAQLVPKSVASVALAECQIPADTPNNEVSKKQRHAIAQWLYAAPVHLIGRAAGSEFVTAGGVDTKEIDPKTMESRITPGLYFAGEIMNVDGVTGGFNLQASWAAGRLAGTNAAF